MRVVKARILDQTHLELNQPLPNAPGGRIEILISSGVDASEPKEAPVRVSSPSHQATTPPSTGQMLNGSRLRQREDAWCRSHPEILRRFAGQWLVLEGEQVIAHGKNPARLVQQARAQGVRIPYVFYVETPRPGVVRLGL